MDPDCAVCHAPASMACNCEARSLEVAVEQAETKMMQSVYDDVRNWVRLHAQDYILEYFKLLTERRKAAHAEHLDNLTSHAYYHYRAPPHPNEIASAQATLKRGIDEDWRASVQRYPEVLEYFYSLVTLSLPPDSDPSVKDPPLSALNGSRKAQRRSTQALAEVPYDRAQAGALARRTPPPPASRRDRGRDRLTPGPVMAHPHMAAPDRRARTAFRGERHAPPPPPAAYYHPHY
ncbi:uncharacterized protein B0I36DRAFT_362944 [Microdochium trichocladiopsis]|uniref:Uncharacterized protein n=1 Tax=Microdochium trichocladiopsis TaxID=1682393 RepID=A0A9P8Y7N5_9PEZI|nr:uncharacterized protein B0I36DRAFT_362944 [Microdochium trichocladiopsis]KAH7031223.1 hypothetical protein B0I36DRAFT_362944 [Microdochium trichocladiopsis]